MAAIDFVWQLLRRFLAWLHGNPPGLLGLALTLGLLGLYRSRSNRNRAPSPPEPPHRRRSTSDSQPPQQRQQPASSSRLECEGQRGGREPGAGGVSGNEASWVRPGGDTVSGARGAAQSKLQEFRRITISLPGTVLEEQELADSATMRGAETVALLQKLLQVIMG